MTPFIRRRHVPCPGAKLTMLDNGFVSSVRKKTFPDLNLR